jgi:hypothetical protein
MEPLEKLPNETDEEYFNRLFPKRDHEQVKNSLAGMTDEEKTAYLLTLQKRTWNCEDPIKAALDAFIDTMGEEYYPLAGRGRSSLYASARVIVTEIGEMESPKFVEWACKKARDRDGLTIKSLYSIEYLIPEYRKLQAERDYWAEELPEDDPMIDCPRCGKRIYEYHVDLDCKFH